MGLAGYLDSLNLDPLTRDKLASYTNDEPPPAPPPPFGTFSGDNTRSEAVQPDIHSRPAAITPHNEENPGAPPGPGLNWKRAGDRIGAAGNAITNAAAYVVPGAALTQAAGKHIGTAGYNAVTGKEGPATEDTGEGVSQEMLDNRNRVAKERGGGGGGDEEEGGGGQRVSQATPGRYVPAHWQDTNRSSTTQHGIDESKLSEGQKQRAIADNYGQWANDDIRKANEKEAIADVSYAAAHKDAVDAYRANAQRVENEKQAYTIREHEKLDALNVAAQAQVDPEAAKGSMGAQILSALAVGLGQFGASLNGGTNTALQIVNGNIDRRIAAQQSNINNAHKALANEQSLYKDNLAAFGDKERAALATKMQYLDQAKAVLDQQYAGAKSNRNDAQYNAMAQGLADKRAEVADQFGIRTADQIATTGSQHFVPGQMVGGSPGGKPLENVITFGKTSFQMENKEQYDKAAAKVQIINELQRLDNRALNLREQMSKAGLTSQEYKNKYDELKNMTEDKVNLLSSKAGQGVVKESEYARSSASQAFYLNGLGVKGELNPFGGRERTSADYNIRRQIKRGDEDARGFILSAGGSEVKRGFAVDASGNRVHADRLTGRVGSAVEQLPPDGARSMRSGQETPTAGAPMSESLEEIPDTVGTASVGSGGGGKGGKGPHVKGRK